MDHAATLRRGYELISRGDVDGFGALLADGFVEHEDLPGMPPNKDGALAFFRMFIAAFPDLRMVPEDIISGSDKVVARVRTTGTHTGEFMGIPASGKSIDVQVIDIMRFAADGLVTEHWGVFDQMAMMQQIGAVPAGPPA